jgi:osmotically inducible protein OsmC
LGEAGLTPEKLETTATVTFDKAEAGWTVTNIALNVKGKVPKADEAAWDKATQAAKTGCPISRLLNTTISMDAKLER